VLPDARLAGSVWAKGPLTNDADDPPEIALAAVLVTVSNFVEVVMTCPVVRVSVPATVTLPLSVTV